MTGASGSGAGRITITGVDVTPDLRQATVWVGVLAETSAEQQIEFDKLLEVKSDFQHAVAKGMTTKFVPKLHFHLDTGGEYAEHISKLLRDI